MWDFINKLTVEYKGCTKELIDGEWVWIDMTGNLHKEKKILDCPGVIIKDTCKVYVRCYGCLKEVHECK